MFEFNALSQFIIALFTHHGRRPRDLSQGQGHELKAKAKAGQSCSVGVGGLSETHYRSKSHKHKAILQRLQYTGQAPDNGEAH